MGDPAPKRPKAEVAKPAASKEASPEAETSEIALIPLGQIVPNPRQPRTEFAEDALQELAHSIREHGVLQPIIVRRMGRDVFELVAGERRFRASQLAGVATIPAIVRDANPQSSLELALIENIQRENIGALEAAAAYLTLMNEFGLTQEQVAERVGKSRSAVANTMRLLRLPEPVLQALRNQTISEGHARALLAVESEAALLSLFAKVVREKLSVRETENLVKQGYRAGAKTPTENPAPDPNWSAVQKALSEYFATKVAIDRGKKGGRILIDFYSDEDLERILEVLGFPNH